MSVIGKLACSLNRRDEVPNQELAKELADKNDTHSIQELVENLSNKNKNIQSDCIKVLYEIALLKPQLVAIHIKEFISLLDNKITGLFGEQWRLLILLLCKKKAKRDLCSSSQNNSGCR